MTSELGYYFRDNVESLTKKKSEFPCDDPSPNLQQCLDFKNQNPYIFQGLTYHGLNLVRAEMLAKQHNLSSEIIIQIQELAILQYLWDFWDSARDTEQPELREMLKLFKITPAELVRIIDLIKEEKEYPLFSYSRATEGIPQELANKIKGTLDWYSKFYAGL
jgi:hypothetical protein